MRSLMILQRCLLAKDAKGVADFLSDIPPKESNRKMEEVGKIFGFKTVKVGGEVYGNLASISTKFGYSNPFALSKLLRTYDILTPKVGGYQPEVAKLIRKKLELHQNDGRAVLVNWKGVLVFGLHSQGEKADSLKLYLFSMELVGSEALDNKEELEQQKLTLQKAKTIGYLMERFEKANNPISKEILREQIENVTGKRLPEPTQGNLKLV